ncbi:growth hormone secretagogue receptor type 1-like [Limulus polyphemus]|uniref:Growth hormone secretagogue receptor type 1-like n=1 Tax=Limulus polyphemus TaxID=6850 RepID=A0ABM1SBK6_LIMPO|nr:growth hormone secretagogue receptor type 1-like [Limulus polyphemus]XP_022241011.1 growth hormone secretagogue receptor type 1-like [Limulus polyphemus]
MTSLFPVNLTDCIPLNRSIVLPNISQFLNCTFSSDVDSFRLEFPDYIRTVATVLCAVVLAVGTIGNILVPVVVCRTKDLRNSTNFFLINLSVADLLVLLVCMPTVLIELHSKPEVWVLGKGMCKTVPFVELTVAHGSILTILAISFERYYAICKPLKAGYKCTKMRALVIIGIVWVVSILITSPILAIAEYTFVEYVDGSTVPVCLTLVQTFWQRMYFISITSVFFGIPFFILVTVYSFIAKHLMLDSGVVSSTMEQSQAKARRQVVMMLVAVVLSFFLCLLPFRVFTVWIIVADPMEVQKLGMEVYYNLLYFCRIMLYTNSAINPILYNLISSKFRDAFLRSLGCRKSRRLLRQVTFTPTSLTLQSSLKSRSSHSSGTYNTVIPPRTFGAKGLNKIL